MSLSKAQLLNATTTSPWTKDFRHLLSFPRHWLRRVTIHDARIKSVAPKDRIKYWNIVPGDQIRIRGDRNSTIHEVLSINRISNRVFLKGIVTEGEEQTPSGNLPPSKNVHYSRCELYVGNYEFPPRSDSAEPIVAPVFAHRIGTSKPYWQPMGHRWEWERFALRTTPQVPNWTGERISIPWPRPEKRTLPQPTVYDTPRGAVLDVTYKPPPLPTSLKAPIPRPPPESAYVKSLLNPTTSLSDEAQAVEVHLYKELSNPHSRAKKQARWKSYQVYTQSLLREFMGAETMNLKGRSVREARAEAAWKWRQRLEDERMAEKKRRWKNRGTMARLIRKKARRERKEVKQRHRLTEMVLRDEHNQIVPTVPSVS